MRIDSILLMVGGVFISSISQILLKKSAVIVGDKATWRAQYLNWYVAVGYGLLFIAMLIPLYAYRFVELKYGAVLESLGYAFVMILSALFLGEKITRKRLMGNVLIIAGIVVFSSQIF